MAHFAELDENNVVVRVIVVNNNELLDENGVEQEQKGIDFCVNHFGGRWIQTSYNRKFRANYAGEGCVYDPDNDVFITQKWYPSWILDHASPSRRSCFESILQILFSYLLTMQFWLV